MLAIGIGYSDTPILPHIEWMTYSALKHLS